MGNLIVCIVIGQMKIIVYEVIIKAPLSTSHYSIKKYIKEL